MSDETLYSLLNSTAAEDVSTETPQEETVDSEDESDTRSQRRKNSDAEHASFAERYDKDPNAPKMDFDALWDDHYSSYFQNIAKKWYYLQVDSSAEDLFQDLWLKVYTRAIQTWPSNFYKSTRPNFDLWVRHLVRNYITDIARRKKTGPREFLQQQRRLDAPIDTAEGEGTVTLLDFIGTLDNAFNNLEDTEFLEKVFESVTDPDLTVALKVILEEDDLNKKQKEDLIRSLTGRSPSQIMRLLEENTELHKLLHPDGPRTPQKKQQITDYDDEDSIVVLPQGHQPEESTVVLPQDKR